MAFAAASPRIRTYFVSLCTATTLALMACGNSVSIGNQTPDAQAGGNGGASQVPPGSGGSGVGGATAAGGRSGAGGAVGAGGTPSTGGARAAGGAVGGGGAPSTGGARDGGVAGAGGQTSPSGGAAAGGTQGGGGALGAGGAAGGDGGPVCPAQVPMSGVNCSGNPVCNYGQTTCCGQTYSGWRCTCQNGLFMCIQPVECNFICPDAGAGVDTAPDASQGSLDTSDAPASPDAPPVACTAAGDPSCPAGGYCTWSDKLCGGRMSGVCGNIPIATCTALAVPVCGCDGNNYPSDCDAARAGVDVSTTAACVPPANLFRCGWSYCQHGAQYCSTVEGGAISNPGSYVCKALPAGCGSTPNCSCVASGGGTGQCTQSADGDVTVRELVP